MGKLSVFNFITLNGFYKDSEQNTSWHKQDEEGSSFAAKNLKSDSILVFGRITYEHMIAFWPTPQAIKSMPEVANGMNSAEKIVFSKTMKKADWNNTRLIKEDIVGEMKKLKKGDKNLTILGSGTIVTQFADAGLIDTYQFMLDPTAIGKGTPVFNDMKRQLDLKLISANTLKNGAVVLIYQPA